MNTSKIGDILLSEGYINSDDLSSVLGSPNPYDKRLGQRLLEAKLIASDTLLNALSIQSGFPIVELDLNKLDKKEALRLPSALAYKYRAVLFDVVLSQGQNHYSIAMSDPSDLEAIDNISAELDYNVSFYCAQFHDIEIFHEVIYQDLMLAGGELSIKSELTDAEIGSNNYESEMSKYIQTLLLDAYKKRASDIHLQSEMRGYLLRYRIDGDLQSQPLPASLPVEMVINRLKSLSDLKIEERKKPQEGRLFLTLPGKKVDVDVRLSIVPTIHGESVSMRLTFNNGTFIDIDKLGLSVDHKADLTQQMKKSHGVILFVGSTGAGKSTSLYSLLSMVNTPDKKIVTLEDPIEHSLPFLEQIEISESLDFATAFRYVLRRDPDIIMLGEIRDKASAETSIRASSSGHKVLSTLHASDAIEGAVRFVAKSEDPLLASMSLDAVVSQRLIKRNCPHCSTSHDDAIVPDHLMELLGTHVDKFKVSKGCLQCRNTGFLGRIGVFELLKLSDGIRELLRNGDLSAFVSESQQVMKKKRMINHALEHLLAGEIALETYLKFHDDFSIDND